jgi:hypothetical protein
MLSLEEKFKNACENAQKASEDCTQHVNAVLSTFPFPAISHFVISDWHDGTTVKTYSFGREH